MVTIEAMGCQTAIAEQILAPGGDDLLTLKGNHRKAAAAVQQHFPQEIEPNLLGREEANVFDAFDDSHGRLVRRSVWTMTDLAPLPELAKWPGLQAVRAVETIRPAHQHAPVTSDDRFYIASLVRSAETFAAMIRQHWHIDNTLHWSFAVTCNEDRCRIRKEHAPENIAALRHIALNLLRQEQSHQISLRQKRLLCCLDEHYLLTILSGEYRKNKATFHAVPPAAPLVPASGIGPPACPGTRLARAWPAAPHARGWPALVTAGRPQEGPDERCQRGLLQRQLLLSFGITPSS